MKNHSTIIKFAFLSILVTNLITACVSPNKLVSQGRNDEAIEILARRLARNPLKDKNVLALERALKNGNAKDMDFINMINKEGRPDRWDEVFQKYMSIKRRQGKVEPLLPLSVRSQNRKADLPFINITDDLIRSKQNAAEYYYAHAQQIMKNNKSDARKAYDELTEIDRIYPNYKDVNTLKSEALLRGKNFVLYSFKNDYRGITPSEFNREFAAMTLDDLNSFWVNYHVIKDNKTKYDYEVRYVLKDIQVSPEQYNQREYEETKRIQDGWNYVYDSKGNVMKDTLGNDIKTPKYKTIKALVKEVHQRKVATLVGELQYFNNITGQIIQNHPVGGDAVFENYAATFIGDKQALSQESLNKIGNSPQPFPSNEAMIMLANSTVKPIIRQSISSHNNVVEKVY